MEILKNAYRLPVFSIEDTDHIVQVINSKEFQEIYSFYAQQIPPESVLNNLPDLEKKMGFYLQYTGQDNYISQMESVLYKKHMPSIEEFLKKPEYMGNSWGITYPYWREKLMEMFKPGGRVFECLSGDTEIPLTNGTVKTIKELYESDTKGLFTYSWDIKKCEFIPGKIGKVIHNGKRKTYKITLSTGKTIRITGNHKVLKSNNKWCKVEDLKTNDSLMPSDSLYVSEIDIPDIRKLTKDEFIKISKESFSLKHMGDKLRYTTKTIVNKSKEFGIDLNDYFKKLDKDTLLDIISNSYSIDEIVSKYKISKAFLLNSAKKCSVNVFKNLKKPPYIISIEEFKEEDAYDISIDGKNHNFALSSGIIVHNCIYRGCIGCLSGETQILTSNGTQSIKSLSDLGENNVFTVFSYDIENNKIIEARAFNARKTGTNRNTVSVVLNDDTEINCTPDHRFLLTDNKYKEALNLKEGDCVESSGGNYTVKEIIYKGSKEDVYDIEVPKYHNFGVMTKSGKLVFLHNSGKTTIARRAALYCIYRLCCLNNPHSMFNIAPDTAISALMISVIMMQAETTVFNPMLQMIRNTPCFKEVRKETSFSAFGPGDPVPFVKNGLKLIFPNNIFLTVGSNINHVIGQSSAIVVMDEAEEKNPQEAFELYTAMRGRIKSRFLDSSYTMCSLISSSKSKNGMVWEYIKKIPKDDPTVMLMEPPIWDVKASVFDYNKGRFWVQVGTKTNPSIILPTEYDNVPEEKLDYVPAPGCYLISVPYEYRRDFENNLEKYLQDYGGITTDTSDRPFDDLSNLGEKGLIPELHLEANLGDRTPLIEKLPDSLFIKTPQSLLLKRYPQAPRFIHIDLASRDASQTGYSMWHIEYLEESVGERGVLVKKPVYVADFISWITAKTRIDHDTVNQLALDLKYKANVNINTISYDQFQSEAIRQRLKQNKEFPNVEYQSVDRTNEAYSIFSQLMLKGQIKVGDCPYLREQLSYIGLEDGKVLTTHKKDMADSCLSYDTKVFLLSGKSVTVEELYKMDIRKEWVLACDLEKKKLIPVKIERVIQKDIPEHLLKFNLSNNRSFSVTEDHLILKRDGNFVEAKDLLVGELLMPFNYYHELNYHDRYRKVVNPFTGKSQFLYKLVSRELLSEKISAAKARMLDDGSKFTVIHHVNHNKNNDTPDNLLPLTNIEHTNLHAMSGKEIKAFHDRSVMKRERTKIINSGLNLMKKVNPEGYRKYSIKHDIETKLSEKRTKEENTEISIVSIETVNNNKNVYDIVLNSIHNFALESNIFVHNCVGSVFNAVKHGANLPLIYPYLDSSEVERTTVELLGYNDSEFDIEEI